MFDIIAAGEILIDLVDTGNLQFSGTVGGAPCNALAQAAKLGSRTAFIGMVGDDAFGRVCASQLDKLGIDRTHLAVTSRADTTGFCHAGRKRRPGLYILPPTGSGYPAHRKKHAL